MPKKRAHLQCDFLVVPVHCLLLIHHKGPFALACCARHRLDLVGAVTGLRQRSDCLATGTARIKEECELWEDAGAARDDAVHPHERVEV
jgi:hypothetical protein